MKYLPYDPNHNCYDSYHRSHRYCTYYGPLRYRNHHSMEPSRRQVGVKPEVIALLPCFYLGVSAKLWVLLGGVASMRALLFGVHIRAPLIFGNSHLRASTLHVTSSSLAVLAMALWLAGQDTTTPSNWCIYIYINTHA